MALQGQLNIEGRMYGVIKCEYEFSQGSDSTGMPSSRPKGGLITFVMPATCDDDQFFYKWMFSKTLTYSGTFRFCVFSNDNKKRYKTVEFTQAFCIGLKDNFSDSDSKLMYTTVTISAGVIRIGTGVMDSALFSNEWASLGGLIDMMTKY